MSDNGQSAAESKESGKSDRNWTLLVLSIVSLVYIISLAALVLQTAPCVPVEWQPQIPPEGFLAAYVGCRTTNELGDFLAGVFAPLAFLWLAGAVLIQSRELRAQKDELELTRGEMFEMRKVATAQAAEARASKDFIGKQTEIMQHQLARAELEDIHSEFEAHIQTFEACLNRCYLDTWTQGAYGTTESYQVVPDEGLPLVIRLEDFIIRYERYVQQFEDFKDQLKLKGKTSRLFGSGDLFYALQRLKDVAPRLGPAGLARAAEIGLRQLSEQMERFQTSFVTNVGKVDIIG